MPDKRKVIFTEGEIYHIYNRSVGNQEILVGQRELKRAMDLIDYYRFPQKIRFSRYNNLPAEDKEKYLQDYKKQTPYI